MKFIFLVAQLLYKIEYFCMTKTGLLVLTNIDYHMGYNLLKRLTFIMFSFENAMFFYATSLLLLHYIWWLLLPMVINAALHVVINVLVFKESVSQWSLKEWFGLLKLITLGHIIFREILFLIVHDVWGFLHVCFNHYSINIWSLIHILSYILASLFSDINLLFKAKQLI